MVVKTVVLLTNTTDVIYRKRVGREEIYKENQARCCTIRDKVSLWTGKLVS
jgi:hypothetical protein